MFPIFLQPELHEFLSDLASMWSSFIEFQFAAMPSAQSFQDLLPSTFERLLRSPPSGVGPTPWKEAHVLPWISSYALLAYIYCLNPPHRQHPLDLAGIRTKQDAILKFFQHKGKLQFGGCG